MLLGIDFVLVCLIVSERACVCALRGVGGGGVCVRVRGGGGGGQVRGRGDGWIVALKLKLLKSLHCKLLWVRAQNTGNSYCVIVFIAWLIVRAKLDRAIQTR
jgi:hypothetical protein